MNLYRFSKCNEVRFYVVAKSAPEAVAAVDESEYDTVTAAAHRLPTEDLSWMPRLLIVQPAAPDNAARIADLERKLAELTAEKVLESVTALANNVKEGLVIRQDFDTAAKIRDQLSVVRNSFGDLLEIIEDAANVLDAQRGEKERQGPTES